MKMLKALLWKQISIMKNYKDWAKLNRKKVNLRRLLTDLARPKKRIR